MLIVVNLDPYWRPGSRPSALDLGRSGSALRPSLSGIRRAVSGESFEWPEPTRTCVWTRLYGVAHVLRPEVRRLDGTGGHGKPASRHREPPLVPDGRLLRDPGPRLLRRQRRRHRRPPGITAKLDYLQWLGVDCLWLLPFYQSPLRDGGYDISDFWTVLPEYGDLADAVELVEEAHRRGIRVIADLVMNHTTDQHPWFQESRQDRTNPKADWYVWSDDDSEYPDARIIFVDTEKSNWTFDAQRGQYYWHRFFSHQPDLNYDNPEVADTMLDVVPLLAGHRPGRLPARRRAVPLRA